MSQYNNFHELFNNNKLLPIAKKILGAQGSSESREPKVMMCYQDLIEKNN